MFCMLVRQIDKEKQVEITYKQELIKKNRILSGLSRDYNEQLLF